MSAKQAKRLRQAARGLAVSLDQAGVQITGRKQRVVDHGAIAVQNTHPKDRVDEPQSKLQLVNEGNSMRGIIRAMKKEQKLLKPR